MPSPSRFDVQAVDSALSNGDTPTKVFREAFRALKQELADRYYLGEDVVSLVRHHSDMVDQLLLKAWQQFFQSNENDLALVAVGGYGRGELHPYSDIDILILVEEHATDRFAEALQQFVLLLWDTGVEIGHSVRTLSECVEAAEADITIATNLMESRQLAGNPLLFLNMRELTDQDHLWPGARFFEAKWEEQINRHHKFNDTAYNLEPNVKEGPGGLRDIQMIGWVAKRRFGVATLHDLVDQHFLTELEYEALEQGQRFLWQVRFGLHVLTDRHEDRLLIEHQRTLANEFGYRDGNGHLAVELFMKEYYRTVMELERLNEMLLQLFQEEILYSDDTSAPIPHNNRFQLRRGFLETVDEQIFERYPFAMLELFLVLAQHPEAKGVRAGTIRQLRKQLPLIDDDFRHDLRCRSLFIELLRQPTGITKSFLRMNRYGVLGAYLPEFGRVVGQMQHDLFHVYTVDEHTMFVLRNIRRLTVSKYAAEYPLGSQLIKEIGKPYVLYIAALFHDIAKGRGGDHSQLGASDVLRFCERHLLSRYDAYLAEWLVRNHLLMSTTAQRKDISDPAEIYAFAGKVGDLTHLDYLYLLTVADIRATSPNVWNSWKDALLAELYHATRRVLRRGLANPLNKDELIDETQVEVAANIREEISDSMLVYNIWDRLSDDYFLRYSVDEITWHTRSIIHNPHPDNPLVLVREETERGGTEVFIYTRIRGHQFTTTTSALEQLGLTILDARIISSKDGYTLDTYLVGEEDGSPITDATRLEEIRTILAEALLHADEDPAPVRRRIARQLKHFPIPTRVIFEQDDRNQRTIMEVVASDRPGLLAKIGHAMNDCKVRLQNAKIATFGERAEDIFFITDRDNRPIEDSRLLEQLKACIHARIDEVTEP